MNAMLLSFGLPQIFPYKSTQVSSSLKRNFESTSSTSHNQELMEEINEVDLDVVRGLKCQNRLVRIF